MIFEDSDKLKCLEIHPGHHIEAGDNAYLKPCYVLLPRVKSSYPGDEKSLDL